MWNKSASLLMIRIKGQKRMRFMVPLPFWVIDEFLAALADLAWVGEGILRHVPVPQAEIASKHLHWAKTISLSGVIATLQSSLKDLKRHKGLEVVEVEVGEVQVKISLK